ncbi:hypothetical protein [Acinetobacter gerneri]|uniref:hypothetical protein n=1 Tax=Acinetobacter gerneri TaxID=202952 RepID=UPI0028ABD4D6|nr:hypothetical protein [Acinetobacter gerneri]
MQNKSIVLTLLLISLMSGCAKKEAASDSSNDAQAADAAQVATDSAIQAEAVHEPNTTPATEQKPEVILNTQVNPAEATRRMVREANVDFTAKDVVKTALDIDKLTFDAGGFVEQKNIDFTVVDTQSEKIADGKIKIFEKVNPRADIIVRIPSEKAAGFVNALLPLMYFLNQQQYTAKRYELRLLEEKISQTQTVPSDSKRPELNEIARLTNMEVQDRVRYSTIHLIVTQPATVRERIDVDIDAVARLNGDNFWKRAWNGVLYGWQFILDLLVILVTIWPLYLVIFVGIILYKSVRSLMKKFIK